MSEMITEVRLSTDVGMFISSSALTRLSPEFVLATDQEADLSRATSPTTRLDSAYSEQYIKQAAESRSVTDI